MTELAWVAAAMCACTCTRIIVHGEVLPSLLRGCDGPAVRQLLEPQIPLHRTRANKGGRLLQLLEALTTQGAQLLRTTRNKHAHTFVTLATVITTKSMEMNTMQQCIVSPMPLPVVT